MSKSIDLKFWTALTVKLRQLEKVILNFYLLPSLFSVVIESRAVRSSENFCQFEVCGSSLNPLVRKVAKKNPPISFKRFLLA